MSATAESLIRDLLFLLSEETEVFATPEDAQYFRSTAKKRRPEPQPIPSPTFSPPQAPRPEPPKPIFLAPPPPQSVHPAPLPVVAIKPTPLPQPETLTKKSRSFSGPRSALLKAAPHFPILEEIPNDAIAKKIAERWKTKNQTAPISILSFTEPAPQKTLLEQIAKALDVYFIPTRLIAAETIEKEKQWGTFLSTEGLKLIIVCDYTLWQLRDLMQHYRETPAQGSRLLGNIPLFLLPDLSLYLKDPLLKRSLWKALGSAWTKLS